MSNFASVLKALRNSRGLTQEKLAAALGVAKSTISMYEVGGRTPDFETEEAIADFFNVDLNYLRGYDGKKPVTFSGDGLSIKKQALIELILRMSDSDVDVIAAAADVLIAQREK